MRPLFTVTGLSHSSLAKLRRAMRHAGFSLVEMLAAMAILAVVTVVLANMANQAGKIWERGESHNQHRQRARAVLDILSKELRDAALAIDSSRPSLQFVVIDPSQSNPSGPSISSQFLNHGAVFWQAPVATDASKGDLAEVGYFVRWDGSQPNLCRFFVNPSDATNYLIYTNPNSWISDALIDAVAPADKASQYRGLFLENVLGLWVRCTKRDPVTGEVEMDGDSPKFHRAFNSRDENNALPAMVEVSLVLIDANTARRLENPGAIKSLCASSDTAEDFIASLPPPLQKGVSIVQNTVALNSSR